MPFPGTEGSCWAANTWAADSWDADAWAGAGEAPAAAEAVISGMGLSIGLSLVNGLILLLWCVS